MGSNGFEFIDRLNHLAQLAEQGAEKRDLADWYLTEGIRALAGALTGVIAAIADLVDANELTLPADTYQTLSSLLQQAPRMSELLAEAMERLSGYQPENQKPD